MMRLLPASLALAACMLLAACEGTLPRVESAPGEPPRVIVRAPAHTNGDELAAYLAKLRGLNETALVAEAARQKRAVTKDASDMQRLRAAIALSLSPQGEEAEVANLVEPIARREGADGNARAMASFLLLFAAERHRLRENASSARIGLRDEKRNAETQKQRADALQERAAQLQQKLDALSELEKSLSDRPPPAQ
ncbi:MAG TPA: hypothetical protein VFE23_09025 [Usitatibacter sp.]|jgi:hypothetical protein|nr:hypothetical protein [Usitatibacter sp.]